MLVQAKDCKADDVADRKSVLTMERKGVPVLAGQTAPKNPSSAVSAAADFPCLFYSAPLLLAHIAVDVAYSSVC